MPDTNNTTKLRTFEQLSPDERAWALGRSTSDLLRFIVDGGLRFENQGLQGRIDNAFQRAYRMQTPWFTHEYVMDAAGDDIRAMARRAAEDRLYGPPGVFVTNVPYQLAKAQQAAPAQ